MGIGLVDPHIANRTRARKNRNLTTQSSAANVVDAGERDAPSFPPAYNPIRDSSSQIGMLEGITGQHGPALNRASRDVAQIVANNKAKNALGDWARANSFNTDRYRTGATPGLDAAIDFGIAQRTPTSLGQGGPSMTDLESYAFDNPVATGSAISDTGGDNTTGGSVLDTIEADLMSGGRQFGDLKTLQRALVKLRGSLNANELQRSRRLEDFALALDKYRRQADRMRRQIPGGFNRRGMLNSGQFDRGMGEFEGQVIRDELEQRHRLQRVLQDLGFADRSAGYEFDETIRENAIEEALASAAKASALSIPGLDGGFTPVGENMMNQYGDAFMDSLIQSMFKG